MKIVLRWFLALVALNSACFWSQRRAVPESGFRDWQVYGGLDGIHYSVLNQINRSNVSRLEVAWTFDTEDASLNSEMQCNPIVIDGLLYATTPRLRVIALDAATGSLRWSFDPSDRTAMKFKARNRGLCYWHSGQETRIFLVAGHYLYALDAQQGHLCADFGEGGRVDLRQGLGRPPETISISATSPGAIYDDLIILGSIVSEDLPSAPGDIRAYDVRTGRPRWTFHTIPRPGEFGYDTWPRDAWKYSGGANNWCGMTVDSKRGLVFVPTGSAAFDFYGANRVGDNLFSDSLIALEAGTGKRVWHFQAVRHDVWDRDFPAAPGLVTVLRDGRLQDAVAQITKSGHVFVFDRETGKSLFPIEYRRVPPSDVAGEVLAETQVLPLQPPAFARQILTDQMLTHRTPEAHSDALSRFQGLISTGQFAPPTTRGTIIFPGFDGGGEWGGAAFDPETGLLYVNSNEMAWVLRLVERQATGTRTARSLYLDHCASCHRADLRGTPPEFPSLVKIGARRSSAEIEHITQAGSGRMPGFPELSGEEREAISRFLLSGKDSELKPRASSSPSELKYRSDGYNKFLDPEGYPAIEPPWGTLTAISLDSGTIAWKIPLGEIPALVARGIRDTGSENYGGPVVTAGGLLFIGATVYDRKFRAFDKATGKLLWETTLSASGNATPAIYEANGREYVVIAAGGGKWGAPSGGSYVAFALR